MNGYDARYWAAEAAGRTLDGLKTVNDALGGMNAGQWAVYIGYKLLKLVEIMLRVWWWCTVLACRILFEWTFNGRFRVHSRIIR